jgi:hypothetical protein
VLEEMGYERGDVSLIGIARASALFFGFAIGMWVLTAGIVWFWNREALTVPEQTGRPIRTIPEDPHPLLQSNITVLQDMYNLRQRESELLSSTEEITPGRYRIPIDQAMDLAVQQIPSRPATVVSPKISAMEGRASALARVESERSVEPEESP